MNMHVGLDISQRTTSICIIDATGQRAWQGSAPTEPGAIVQALREHGASGARVGMETGPLAVWLYHAIRQQGVNIDCIHARHVHAALTVQLNKTDRNDAFGIAQLVRSGWYRPTHVRSLECHQMRLMLTVREKLIGRRTAINNQIRGLLKTFGVVLGTGRGRVFETSAKDADPSRDCIKPVIGILLDTWRHLTTKTRELDRSIQRQVNQDRVCRLLMTVPGVGVITAASFKTAVDDPSRFKHVSDIGPFLGLTPRKYQSGDVDRNGTISKHGNRQTRSMLYEASLALLKRYGKETSLGKWGAKLEHRMGLRKAVVALARKLATVLLSMWRNGEQFRCA